MTSTDMTYHCITICPKELSKQKKNILLHLSIIYSLSISFQKNRCPFNQQCHHCCCELQSSIKLHGSQVFISKNRSVFNWKCHRQFHISLHKNRSPFNRWGYCRCCKFQVVQNKVAWFVMLNGVGVRASDWSRWWSRGRCVFWRYTHNIVSPLHFCSLQEETSKTRIEYYIHMVHTYYYIVKGMHKRVTKLVCNFANISILESETINSYIEV